MLITLELVRYTWQACYSHDRLVALFNRPHTLVEVLTRKDGLWADVPAKDRIWAVCHKGVLSDRTFRHFAADCAEKALMRERKAGREPDPRSWKAVTAARAYAESEITKELLDEACTATYSDAYAAAYAASTAAAYAANASDAYAAAYAASTAAAFATDAAAYADAREWQIAHLLELIKKYEPKEPTHD